MRQHAEAFHVGRRRGGKHHARAIVPREHDRALRRARRQHDVARPDVPESFHLWRPLERNDVAVVVDAEGRRSRKNHRVDRWIVDPVALVHQDHAVAAADRGGRRRAPGWTAADHERLDVPVHVHRIDRGHLRRIGKSPHAGSRLRDEPVHEFDHRGGDDRIEPGLLDLDERVWLLGPRRHHAAGSAEDRAPESTDHPVRKERARERVSLEALVLDLVEAERDRPRTVDPGTACVQPSAHAGGSSPIRYVAMNRCVDVSRTALNHRRHPWT